MNYYLLNAVAGSSSSNTLAVVGFVSGCEIIQEFLITRKKNQTPNSPNELLERWIENKNIVDYLKDIEN